MIEAAPLYHNAQITNMFAVAYSPLPAWTKLAGQMLRYFAVPAEEMIEIDYRNKLRGKPKYMGGKQQPIYEGSFWRYRYG